MAGLNRPTVFIGPTPEFPALMSDKLMSMRDNGSMTDFTITTRDAQIQLRCHKLVLAIHSPYLEAMFTSDMVEATTNTVHYDNISLETMRLVIDYCYHEQIGFPEDQLIQLITASDYLQMERLKKRCVNEVENFLTIENVLEYFTFADVHNVKEIKSWCMKIIIESFCEVSTQPDFLTLTYAELKECLDQVLQSSDAKRDDVLGAVFQWIDDDVTERKEYLEEFMQLVQPEICSLLAILGVMETHEAIIAANVKVLALLAKLITAKTVQFRRSVAEKEKPEKSKQLVIVGGQVGEHVNHELWSLDEKENQFSKLSTMPFPELAPRHSVCEIPEGIALTGGEGSDLCVIFIASIKRWRRMPKMLRKRYRHASICINDKLYVLCGTVLAPYKSASMDCLTLETGQWEGMQVAPVPAIWPTVAELNGNLFFLDVKATKKLFTFDTKKSEWNQLNSPPGFNLETASMIAVNGQLCVAGGRNFSICAWYNPSTNTWSMSEHDYWLQLNPNNLHHYGSLVQQDSETLLLLGGYKDGKGTDYIEEFNTADRLWSLKDVQMPVAYLWGHKAFYLDVPQD